MAGNTMTTTKFHPHFHHLHDQCPALYPDYMYTLLAYLLTNVTYCNNFSLFVNQK